MNVSDAAIPVSIFDYSFSEEDGSELEPYLSIPMADNFGFSDHKKQLPPAIDPDYEFQFLANEQNMSLPNDETPTTSISHGADTIGNISELPNLESFPLWKELLSPELSCHIFPSDDEPISSYEMSPESKEHSDEGNLHALNDIFMPRNNNIPSSQENPNCEGAVCAEEISVFCHGEAEIGIRVVQLLLQSGQMIGEGFYDTAVELVSRCQKLCSQIGSPTQRLGYYICSALHERIEQQTPSMLKNASRPVDENERYRLLAYSNIVLPYFKVIHFTSVQAIIDVVGNAPKIHVIDLGMQTGSNWTVLMEFLSHRSSSFRQLQLLRITAVGMNREVLLKTGERLRELAESLVIPFSYGIVETRSIEDIKEDLFTVRSGECLAVFAPAVLRNLLYDPVRLQRLLGIIKRLRPRVVVNIEVEAEHNSPLFMKRFSEVLSHYMAYFDMLDVTIPDRNDLMRVKHEELIIASQIKNMLVYERSERKVRHVSNHMWRCLFKKAGFRENSFSFRAMYRAKLLFAEFASTDYNTLDAHGRAIILKWKGTPLLALSTWSGT